MTDVAYGYSRNLGKLNFEDAKARVVRALKNHGFGVLTEIDVQSTLKNKLDVAFRNYMILGACNPPLAHKSLSSELMIGLLLPCNVILFEEDDGSVTASAINPREMFKVVNNPELQAVAGEVDAKLRAVIESIE